jgi:hypothetical protein
VIRWGLVPFWAKDMKVGFANINAKAEGIESKPAFREAFHPRPKPTPKVGSVSVEAIRLAIRKAVGPRRRRARLARALRAGIDRDF